MSGFEGLGKFLKRATHKLQEKAGRTSNKTVDEDFERKKAAFSKHKDDFAALVRRTEAYYKGQKKDSENFSRLTEALQEYGGSEFTSMAGVSHQARAEMDAGAVELKLLIHQYNDQLKFVSQRIEARDGACIDLDMKRTKMERAGDDPVARATCSAALQVYDQVNAQVHANLDMFLSKVDGVMRSFASMVIYHQHQLLSSAADFPAPKKIPAPDLSLTNYTVVAPVVQQAHYESTTHPGLAQPSVSPRQDRSPRSPGLAQPSVSPRQDRSPRRAVPPAPVVPVEEEEPDDGSIAAIVLYDYDAEPGDGGLSIREGQRVTVTEKSDDGEWWYAYSATGEEGYVPCDFLKLN